MSGIAMEREPFGGSLFYHPDILGQFLDRTYNELEYYHLAHAHTQLRSTDAFLALSHVYLTLSPLTSPQSIGRDINNIMHYVGHFYEDYEFLEWIGDEYPQEIEELVNGCIPYITPGLMEYNHTILKEFLTFCKSNYAKHRLTETGHEVLTNITQGKIS